VYRKMLMHADAIRAFVAGGGKHFGSCMGGYLAGRPEMDLLPGNSYELGRR